MKSYENRYFFDRKLVKNVLRFSMLLLKIIFIIDTVNSYP